MVVLNWNGREDTLACLASLREVRYPNLHVVVVDNGSGDGSVPAIRERFPEATVLETGRNLGFAGGNNVGIRKALERGADFVLIVNNDAVVAADLVEVLLDAARRHPDAGVLAARINFLSDRHRIWYAGARWRLLAGSFEHVGQGQPDDGRDGAVADTDYACGCGMFVRADTLRTVGLFDESYFLLFEDADWGYRCRKAGYRCLVVPRALVWHKVSASMGDFHAALYQYFHVRNRLLWAERHLSRAGRAAVWIHTALDLTPNLRAVLEALWPLVARLSARHAYWGLRQWAACLGTARRDPGRRLVARARRRAVADYLRRRFGDCPPEVRAGL